MSLPLTPGTYQVDTAHSSASFSIRHLGISNVRGRLAIPAGQLVVGDDLASTNVSASVDVDSLDTNDHSRDAHVKSPDFLDSAAFPTFEFKSTSIQSAGEEYILFGNLTIKGNTRPVELAVEFNGAEKHPFDGATRVGFEASTTISKKDFGVEFNAPLGADKFLLSDKLKISLDMQFIAQ